MKKYVITLPDNYQMTDEEVQEVERQFIEFLYDASKKAIVLGPGVKLDILDFEIDEPCQVVVDGSHVRKVP